jgi:hypothetical protein
MQFSISDNMISEFASGLFAVFALIGVGAMVMLLLTGLGKKFPFTRLALVLALTPFSLFRFLENGSVSTLYLYAVIVVLLGITIDGINYLLVPKEAVLKTDPSKAESEEPEEKPDPGMIVWEKAE